MMERAHAPTAERERQYLGEWFLPDEPERRVAGTLTYQSGRGGSLELIGSFGGVHPHSGRANEIILGETISGGHITLWRCWPVPQPEILGHRGPRAFVFSPERAFLGHHFVSPEELRFSALEIHLSALDAWVGLGGFATDWTDDGRLVATHLRPQPVRILTAGGPSLSIDFRTGPMLLFPALNVTLVQHTFFRAEDAAEPSVDEWLELVTRLQMLLIFATEQLCASRPCVVSRPLP